ncbi:MAG: aspartate carbamoyltransferase regulatory subunit [Bacteroidales bacterium]|jgi:aspartate carbamoyltransferase regulatory subunit|nr:aspartate carbamoyltransferase regulatory subunit [Bacteroidales bacterium]
MNKKELLVAGLQNGTVIDHIPSDRLFKVVSMLKLDTLSNPITIGNNLMSKKSGTKGIIKVTDKYFEKNEIDRIALIAPHAKLNRIANYEVVEKKELELPDELIDIVKCANPKCICNNEPMASRFDVIDKKNIVVKCHYCEKDLQKDDIVLL